MLGLNVCAPVPGCVLFKFIYSICHLKVLVYHLHCLQVLGHKGTPLLIREFHTHGFDQMPIKGFREKSLRLDCPHVGFVLLVIP